MGVFNTKLISKKEVARDTMEFRFEKPEGLEFRAGNSFDWTIVNPSETDKEGNTRTFSTLSTPTDRYIGFATRMRDTAYKRVLKNADPGLEIKIEGPFGTFFLHKDELKPAVFLAGGVGITPFMSILRDVSEKKLSHKIFLFYSNKTIEDAAYLQELQELEKENQNVALIAIMTKDEKWKGEKGHVNKEILEKYLGDLISPTYYMAGPPQMIAGLREILVEAGNDEESMKWEEFSGY